ncbi:unnamed protein product, partial [Effrenium voratum]
MDPELLAKLSRRLRAVEGDAAKMPPSSRCPTESKVPGRLQCPRSWYMPRQESSESDMDSPGIRPKKVRVPEWVVEGCRSYPMERCTTAPAWYPRTGASSAREVCFDEEVQVESEAQLQRRLQQAEKERNLAEAQVAKAEEASRHWGQHLASEALRLGSTWSELRDSQQAADGQ